MCSCVCVSYSDCGVGKYQYFAGLHVPCLWTYRGAAKYWYFPMPPNLFIYFMPARVPPHPTALECYREIHSRQQLRGVS
jgi:hypothetical protein